MDEKKQLTAEEELKILLRDENLPVEDNVSRFVDLIIDLIAERSEEKAEEIIENHKIDYDHDLLYGR